jgi:hypothetical protein
VDPDPDPGGQKLPTQKEKSKEFSRVADPDPEGQK